MDKDLKKNKIDYFPSISSDNKELFSLLNRTSEILCEWFSETKSLSPLPSNKDFKCSIPKESGCDIKLLLEDIHNLIYCSFNPSHPGSLAHLDPPPLAISIVGDLISGGLNNNLLAEELSPCISIVEKEICNWIANQIGFNNLSGGIAASGGTLNNLNALVTARFISGLESDPNACFVISEDAHSSFKKCARILGIKQENIILVKTDNNGCMFIPSLIQEIDKAKNLGKKIFSIIATLGTTIRGAIDPVNEIARICREKNIWFHIDGSIGGIFSISNNSLLEKLNINVANSITINPQKLLGIAKTSSLLLVSDISNLKRTFYTGLPYVDSSNEILNRGELGIQGSRPAEIIKLWLGLRYLGIKGIDNILEETISKKSFFEEILDKKKFDTFTGPLHIITFIPKYMNKEKSDQWTLRVKNSLLRNKIMISRPFYKGRYLLRIVFGNYNTSESDIKQIANFLNNQL